MLPRVMACLPRERLDRARTLSRNPLFSVDVSKDLRKTFWRDEMNCITQKVQDAVQSLTVRDRAEFDLLYHDTSLSEGQSAFVGTRRQNVSRVYLNRFELTDRNSVKMEIYKDCSRATNSCVPNAHFYQYQGQGRIRSLVSVGKDEEITIQYLESDGHSPWPRRSDRARGMAYTLSGEGFTCDCKACKDDTPNPGNHAFYQASDGRRDQLEALRRRLVNHYPMRPGKTFTEVRNHLFSLETNSNFTSETFAQLNIAAKSYVDLMEAEGICGEQYLVG